MIITVNDSEPRFIGMRTGSESLRKSNFEKLISKENFSYKILLLPIGHFAEFLHFVGYPIFITKFIYKEVVYVFDN